MKLHGRSAQKLGRSGIQKDGVGRKKRHAIGVQGRYRHQVGCGVGHHQHIDPHHPQGHAFALGRDGVGADFQHGGGHGHLRVAGDAGKNPFVKVALHTAQLQVRLAANRTHGLREFVQCRGVDQMH